MKIASAWYPCGHWNNMVEVNSPRELEGSDLLILHGGADIATELYGAERGMSTSLKEMSRRDAVEVALAKVAIKKGIPILGICRGAQLLCALSGGSLWQHVHNHVSGQHELVFNGRSYVTNSCHHQMMIPPEDAQVLGYTPPLSKHKFRDGSMEPELHLENEPEIVYFPKFKALGVQGHPEWLTAKDDLNIITNKLVGELLNVEISCRR